MIEIFADEFSNGVLVEEHAYLNENRISLVSAPILHRESRKLNGAYIDVWKFSIVIDGSSQGFSYVNKDACDSYYEMVLQAFLAIQSK